MNIKAKNMSILFALVASLAQGATPSPLPEWQVCMSTMSKLDLDSLYAAAKFLGPNPIVTLDQEGYDKIQLDKKIQAFFHRPQLQSQRNPCGLLEYQMSALFSYELRTVKAEGPQEVKMPAVAKDLIGAFASEPTITRGILLNMLEQLRTKVAAKVADMMACNSILDKVLEMLSKMMREQCGYYNDNYSSSSFASLVSDIIHSAKLIPEADILRSYLARNPNLKSEKPEQVPFLSPAILISRLEEMMLQADRLGEIWPELNAQTILLRRDGYLPPCDSLPRDGRIDASRNARKELIRVSRSKIPDREEMLRIMAEAYERFEAADADAELARSQMDSARKRPTKRELLKAEKDRILGLDDIGDIKTTQQMITENIRRIELLPGRLAKLIHALDRARDRARAPDTSAAADSD